MVPAGESPPKNSRSRHLAEHLGHSVLRQLDGVAFLKNTELGRGQVAGDFKQVSNGA